MMDFSMFEGQHSGATHGGDIGGGRMNYMNQGDGGSTVSTTSSARRSADGIVFNFARGGETGIRLAADVDELERERLLALMDVRHMTWRHRWYSILEGRPHEFDETLSLVFNIVSFSVVIISCIVFAVASVPDIISPEAALSEVIAAPTFWIEAVCILYFIAEAILRIVCVPLHLLITPLFVIDIATIIGFFTDFFADSSVSFLRVLRLLRVFRVMKISRYSRTLQLVFKVFAQSASGLSVLLMPIFLVVITAATVLYFVEISDATFDTELRRWVLDGRPSIFQTVFDGIWFTMATITTIGYGDLVPQTLGGKLIAALLSLFGVLTLSFPNLVLGANLESAFALHKRLTARTFFSKRFRKVWIMVAFLRRARIMAETSRLKLQAREMAAQRAAAAMANNRKRKKDGNANAPSVEDLHEFGYSTLHPSQRLFPLCEDEPQDTAIGGLAGERGRALFYEMTTGQCASLVQGENQEAPEIHDDNVRLWSYKGIKVRPVLQTLFEAWSGVATLQEIYEAFPNKPDDMTIHDLAVACTFMGAAKILNIFVFRRASIQFMCSLTYRAVLELSLGRENATMDCRRSAEFARFIWKQTTGRVTVFSHATLAKNYASWAAKEKYAGMGTADSSPDLKLHIGLTAGELNECRRILQMRTSDLATVIPDMDRFQEQAEERMNFGSGDMDSIFAGSFNSKFHFNKSREGRDHTSRGGGQPHHDQRHQHQVVGSGTGEGGGIERPDEAHRKVMRLLLLHQRSLAEHLGISLEPSANG